MQQGLSTSNGAGLAAIFTIMLIAFAIALIPLIFYLLTLQKALNSCAPENRAMQPAMVWLMLIPAVESSSGIFLWSATLPSRWTPNSRNAASPRSRSLEKNSA